jgi:flagellar protein FlaJ
MDVHDLKAAAEAVAAKESALIETPHPSKATILSFRFFGKLAAKQLPKHPALPRKLAQARDPRAPVAYLAAAYGHMLVAGALGTLPLLLYVAASPIVGMRYDLLVALVAAPIIVALFTYSFDLLRPDLQIAQRRRGIEDNLPVALTFMASLASAGVVPANIFGALGAQPAYGEVAKEAAWIYRDTRVFQRDIVAAMRAAARRSPSRQFEEFLQGAINGIGAGGDFKAYLMGKADQFSQEQRRKQKAFLESMGIMAESYVVVGAATPLFLIVILSVMAIMGTGGDAVLLLNVLALLALPAIHGMFVWIMRSMRAD